MAGPDSSYSALEIHIDWNVDKDEVLFARSFARPGQARRINTPRRGDVCSVA